MTIRDRATLFMMLPHPVARGAVSAQYEAAAKAAKHRLAEPALTRYRRGVAYGHWDKGSTAQRFEMRGENEIDVEWVTKYETPEVPPAHLIATASKRWDGTFSTGWARLRAPDGRLHPYGKAKLSFEIAHHDGDIIKIEGNWSDRDEFATEYPFNSVLQRLRSI